MQVHLVLRSPGGVRGGGGIGAEHATGGGDLVRDLNLATSDSSRSRELQSRRDQIEIARARRDQIEIARAAKYRFQIPVSGRASKTRFQILDSGPQRPVHIPDSRDRT